MFKRNATVVLLFIFLVSPSATFAQQPAASPSPAANQGATSARDPNDPIERIKDEGMNRSQVMQTLSYLSDVIGPRLTASPRIFLASSRDRMAPRFQDAHSGVPTSLVDRASTRSTFSFPARPSNADR